MEDEIDIYADLPNFNVEDNENLAEKNKKLSQKCMKLEKQVTDLTQSLESLQKVNTNLEVNLSSLLQTAKAEIARKDRMIADIRRQLDNMQFRRGEYSKSVKPARSSPPRRKRENSPKESSNVIKVPEPPDTTEFMCSNPPPVINLDEPNSTNKSHQLDGIVSTIFGERLRKRIIDEEEEERKQKEQSKSKVEIDSKKTSESIRSEKIVENDSVLGLKTESLKSDCKISNIDRLKNKGSREDPGFLKRNHSDRKRQLEDRAELASSYKKSKINDGKSRYRDICRHNDRGTRSSVKNSSKSKIDEQPRAEIIASDDQIKYHIVDEYEANVENDVQNKSESINTADDNETQDRHNRVAIRLMLLAEGIDPDLEAKKSVQNEQKKIIEDKLEGSKKSKEISRSRSKSKNRRYNNKSRSRTPDKYRKSRRRSRQREDRRRPSRDRFERRRDLKNKDGDNLSQFSREIQDLKERFEDRSSDRAGKGRNLNRFKQNDERICKSGRSRTPDSSRSGSKDRMVHRSRTNKKFERSRSQERHKSRNRGKRYTNFDEISTHNSETVVQEKNRADNVEIMPVKTPPQVTENPETQSLISLEDGEIVDSSESSPVKLVAPVQTSTEKNPPSDCQFNLLNSNELLSVIADVKYSLPLREIGNSQTHEKSLPLEKPVLSIPEFNRPMGLNNCLNTSKDERIEKIAEFIANFSTDVSESKIDEKSDEKIIHSDAIQPDAVVLEEKAPQEQIQFILNTTIRGSSKDSPLVSPPIENSDPINMKNLNGNNGDDDWCLIAIDSPIKNFEENRKNRMMAQNLQLTVKLEPPKNVSNEELSLKHSNNSAELLRVDESNKKMNSKSEKIVSDKVAKPLVPPMKNSSKTKPAVLTSLRSTYHKGRKPMILSDTNSEQCTKILMSNLINSAAKELSCESETIQKSKDDIKKTVQSENIGKFRSKSPVLENVDRNFESSQKEDEKTNVDNLLSDKNNSMMTDKDKKVTAYDQSDINGMTKVRPATIAGLVDETVKKNEKSEESNSKTEKETATKISLNLKPELRNSIVKESESKESKACKKDFSNGSKGDVIKSIVSKKKISSKLEKTNENNESNISKSLENGMKSTKTVPKAKVEGSNSKQKKEMQKLIVSVKRRKPVHLEDSSASSSIVMNPNSLSDTDVKNSEKSTNNDIKSLNSLDLNGENLIEHGDHQEQRTIAKNDAASDHQSEFLNAKEERAV